MTKSIIDQAVDRFLGWKLPQDFNPDCGITFKSLGYQPTGTNLFHAGQAKAMLEHILGNPAPIPYDQHEAEILKVIDERDAAEEALAQAYFLVMGHSAEWSNIFGHAEALEEIGDAVNSLKLAVQPQA
jgi:hypothetical protein